MSINRVNISGNLTRDPEIRVTQGGTNTAWFMAKVTYSKAATAKAKWLSGYKVLSVDKKTGKVKVKACTWPGTYKLMVKVKAAKTANTKAASKKVTVTVKVKAKAAKATAALTAAAVA